MPPRRIIILWERIKLNPPYYMLPLAFFLIFLMIPYFILSVGNSIKNIDINTLIAIILFFQAFFALIQLFIVYQQKNYAKLSYLPKLIVYTSSPTIFSGNWKAFLNLEFPLYIKNLGEIAYNLSYQIVIKKRHEKKGKHRFDIIKSKEVTENTQNGKEFFLDKGSQKLLMTLKTKDDFIEKKIVVDVTFEDMFYSLRTLRFIKLPQETGFTMITTGQEYR